MKKLLYILSLVLLTVSCAEELVELKPMVDGNKVTIDFSVSVPEVPVHTKAFADAPALTNLYLAVFDENGFLVEYVKTDPNGTELAIQNGTSYKYSAKLTLSDTKRIIHFIANAPTTLRYGTEEEVITALYTEGANDAYWYRKEINGGIRANRVNSVLVPTEATVQALNNIPLVRNFAKIEVRTKQDCAFKLQSYAVINAPNKGSVAAYNRTTGSFVDYPDKTAAVLRAGGYDAFVPGDATLNSDITNLGLDEITTPSPSYIYERETPTSNPVYILVYGQFGNKNVYYRVDLRDDDGNYFPLLRNFQYTITINTVTHTGYPNPQDAANSAGSGDISTSIETEHLTNISDGAVRLTVDYTSKVLVTESNVELKYKLDNLGGSTLNSVVITSEGEALSGIVVGEDILSSVTTTTPQSGNWITLVVDPAQIGTEQKKGTITILATYDGDRTIQRKVTYTLRRPYEMEIKCVPEEIPYGINEKVKVNITIPDDLGSSMFPLEFNIEAQNLSITPDNDNLPVASGLSTIPGVNKSAFWFVKSLSKEEYDALPLVDGKRTFQCHFKANKRESATRVYVTNPYFVAYVDDILTSVTGLQPYDVDDFGNYDPRYFQNLNYTVNPIAIGTDKTTSFTFTMTAAPEGPVTVTLVNARPADGEEDLTGGTVDKDGNAVFVYNTNTTSGSFDLLTTTDDKAVEVRLTASHFVPNSLEAKRDWMQFSNLTISPTRLLQGVGRSASISFRMDADDADYATNEVTIKLVGLQDATGKSEIKIKPVSSGNVSVTNRTVTISGLTTTTVSDPVKFTVSASGYETTTSAEKTRSRGSFSNLSYTQNGGTVTSLPTTSQQVDFNFTLSDYDPNMTINVTLDGFEPVDNTVLMTKAGEYIYKPNGVNCTFKLKTSNVTGSKTCSVLLSTDGFDDAERVLSQTDIKNGRIPRNRTISGTLVNVPNSPNAQSNRTFTISIEGNESKTFIADIKRENIGTNWNKIYEYSYTVTIGSNWDITYTDAKQLVTITVMFQNYQYSGTCTIEQLINANLTGVELSRQ